MRSGQRQIGRTSYAHAEDGETNRTSTPAMGTSTTLGMGIATSQGGRPCATLTSFDARIRVHGAGIVRTGGLRRRRLIVSYVWMHRTPARSRSPWWGAPVRGRLGRGRRSRSSALPTASFARRSRPKASTPPPSGWPSARSWRSPRCGPSASGSAYYSGVTGAVAATQRDRVSDRYRDLALFYQQ